MRSRHQLIIIIFILTLFLAGCGLLPTPKPVVSASPPADAEPGDRWTSSVDGMTLVLVPAGEFRMGSDDGDYDERPLRTEYTEAFWIDLGDQTASCDYAVMFDPVLGNGCGTGDSAWAVGSKPEGASPYGVLDMAGNVWEWVEDWDPYATNGAGRVLRGGGYFSIPATVRAAKREVLHLPLDKNDGLGFRCGASAE
jgi:formylglycine-generating enzyme required for sulfatase activity